MRESDILFEKDQYWVSTADAAGLKHAGFIVWKNTITHSKRVATIGYSGTIGLEKAKAEIDRRLLESEFNRGIS